MRLNLAIIPAPHEGAFGDEATDSDRAEPYGVCRTRNAGEAPARKGKAFTMSLFSGIFGPSINELAVQARETPGSVMIDVRSPEEYRDGHIEGALSIPLVSIPATAAKRLPKEERRGARSAQVVLELERQGYTCIVNMGGIGRWSGPLVR